VPGITVKIHTRIYNSQKCTLRALVNKIKKDVILDILSQVWNVGCPLLSDRGRDREFGVLMLRVVAFAVLAMW
jgi:hypothetical protein